MKNMKKFLSVALCALMLFAMAIPAMAEGEVTINKLDYALNEGDFGEGSFTSASSVQPEVIVENGNNVLKMTQIDAEKTNGIYVGGNNSANAVADYVYEAGFKIKLTNPGVANNTLQVQLMGSASSYPVLNNLKFVSYASHDYDYRLLRSSALVADRDDGLITGDYWNDIRFLITESTTDNTLTYKVYVNGVLCYTRENQSVTDLNTETDGKAAARNPYRWVFYYDTLDESSIYIDDVYIAKYEAATSFEQEPVNVSVECGQEAVLPTTVNVNVNGVTEAVSVDWDAVDTTTAGTKTVTGVVKGYTNSDASDVTVTATVTVAEPAFPYELAIADNTLTITKAGTLTPEAKVYGAVYENGLLTDVQILGTVSDSTEWTDSKTTLSLDEGKTYRAFVVNNQLVPYAISTSLN